MKPRITRSVHMIIVRLIWTWRRFPQRMSLVGSLFFRCLSFDFEYCAGKGGFLLLSKRSQWLWLWMWWRANVNWAWFRQLGLMERLWSLNSLWGCRLISGMDVFVQKFVIQHNTKPVHNCKCKLQEWFKEMILWGYGKYSSTFIQQV